MLAPPDLLADLKHRETVKSIAARYQVHRSTVWRWLQKLQCNQTLRTRKGGVVSIVRQRESAE